MPAPGTEAIELDALVTEEDYVEAFVAHAAKSTSATRKLLVFVAVVTGLVVAVGWPVPIGAWVLLIPATIVGFVLAPRQPRFFARRAYRLQHPAWRDFHMVLDDARVTTRSDKLESYRAWKQIDGWLETPRLIVLLAGGGVCDILPKASFEGADLEPLRALLDRKLHLEGGPAPTAQRKDSRTGKIVLWIILFCLLIAVYALWRAGA